MTEAVVEEQSRKRLKPDVPDVDEDAQLGERKRVKLDATETADDDQLKKEQKAGITHFVNPNTAGFSGVLKQRYTDFLVNEISPDGQVLHLTSTAVPIKKADTKPIGQPNGPIHDPKVGTGAVSTEEKDAEQKKKGLDPTVNVDSAEQPKKDNVKEISKEEEAELESLFGEPCVKALLKLYQEVLKHPERKAKDFYSVSTWSIDDKMKRGQAHQAIRRIFDQNLASTHADKNQIVINKASKGGRLGDGSPWSRSVAGDGRGKGKLGWDELGGEYLHFNLHKENKDTMEVVSFLGSQLKCAPKHFQFAGTKDRRAVTVQRVSVYRQKVWQLAGINKVLKYGSRIGNFKYEQTGLELGALWGNEFVITLRDCHFPEEDVLAHMERLELAKKVVGEAVERFKLSGYLNYYGLQRFGSFSAGTDDIGKKLLQGDFEGAVSLILDFHPSALEAAKKQDTSAKISSDDKARALALDCWKSTRDQRKAIEIMPRKFGAETAIIRHLGTQRQGKRIHERDFQGAMGSISRNLRLMYVHAYQSLVWNTVAGHRWEKYGSKTIEGDLIIVGHKGERQTEEVDEDGEPIVRPAAADSAAIDGDFTRARPLTKAEAESGKWSIFDVVLPLPGWDVVYPPNEVGEFYKEFMGSERGGGLNPHDMRRKWKDYSLSGGYRKLLARPKDGMSWEVRVYKDETEQLVETDLDRLERKSGNGASGKGAQKDGEVEPEGEHKHIAVILRMQLGASQYATMALRELCKAGGVKVFKADFGGRG